MKDAGESPVVYEDRMPVVGNWSGFNGPPDPLVMKAFERAVEIINALPSAPDLVLFTGDLTPKGSRSLGEPDVYTNSSQHWIEDSEFLFGG